VAEAAPVGPVARPPWWRRALAWLRAYFVDQDPTFWVAFTPALVIAAVLFVRSPGSNYIFDEQEALLANPYVNAKGLGFWDVFRRDFWGLPPERTIGSYRPLPDIIWRLLWHVSHLPWLHHWVNVVVHAVNAALLASLVLAVTKKRKLAWASGAAFAACALLTETVSGVVGLADVLGGLGVLLALSALRLRLWAMPLAVFGAMTVGLFSKESVIVALPLVAWAALVWSPAFHDERPRRVLRAVLALTASIGALVFYTWVRKKLFPVALPAELTAPLPATDPAVKRALWAFMRWFRQPRLPHDAINNPLVDADFPHRVAGALRVYFSGLIQLVFPWTLSGDYSFPQEPVPTRVVFPGSVLGGLALVGPPIAGVVLWIVGMVRDRRARRAGVPSARSVTLMLLAVGLVWVPVAYFPHSNIPVLLPTVRAERFWYLPAMGSALVVGAVVARLLATTRWRQVAVFFVVLFFSFQGIRARMHALDYTDDLHFWQATARAVPRSAKAQLNYSVMVGAHTGNLQRRLELNAEAMRLAPKWPMAHVYYGDTLCRMNRPDDAWPHYVKGFELGPNDPNLIALGLQCLWDHKSIEKRQDELLALASEHPSTWLAYFATEIVYRGDKHGGVEKKYRPRGYDEGPKD